MANTGVRFPAQFDPDAWERDIERSTPAGRDAAESVKRDYERSGVPREQLGDLTLVLDAGGVRDLTAG